MRSTVPRMKDNSKGLNPAGDLALGSYQADAYMSHNHLGGTRKISQGSNGEYGSLALGNASGAADRSGDNHPNKIDYTSTVGGNETRAKSTTVNFFIKINKVCNFL